MSVHAVVPLVQTPPLHSDAFQASFVPLGQTQQLGAQSVCAWVHGAPGCPVPVMFEGDGQPRATWSVAAVVAGAGVGQKLALAVSLHAFAALAQTPPEHSDAAHPSWVPSLHPQQLGAQSVSAWTQGEPAAPVPLRVVADGHVSEGDWSVAWVVGGGGGGGQKVELCVSAQAFVPLVQTPPEHSEAAHSFPVPSLQSQQEGAQSRLASVQKAPAVPVPLMVVAVGQVSEGDWFVAVVGSGGVAVTTHPTPNESPSTPAPNHFIAVVSTRRSAAK